METKSLPLEVDSLSHEKGTATIAHAVYDNIDLVNDIARKSMFTRSWNAKKLADGYDISFYLNHDDTQAPGRVTNVHDNNEKAFTDVKMGTHTLGADTLKMMDEGVIRKASFGYKTIKANILKPKNTRELKEVDHLETSVLTRLSANPKAGVVTVTKSLAGYVIDLKQLSSDEQKTLTDIIGVHSETLSKMVNFAAGLAPESDIYTTAQYWVTKMNDCVGDMKSTVKWNGTASDGTKLNGGYGYKSAETITELKEHLARLRKFVRNTTATDETILAIEDEIKSLELSMDINTADTPLITDPSVSESELKELSEEMLLLTFKHF